MGKGVFSDIISVIYRSFPWFIQYESLEINFDFEVHKNDLNTSLEYFFEILLDFLDSPGKALKHAAVSIISFNHNPRYNYR